MIKIKIQTLEDSKRERLAMPEIKGKAKEGLSITCCVMEDMTKVHKAGVAFVIENQDGTYSTKLITQGEMDGMISAYQGALLRFDDLRGRRISEQN